MSDNDKQFTEWVKWIGANHVKDEEHPEWSEPFFAGFMAALHINAESERTAEDLRSVILKENGEGKEVPSKWKNITGWASMYLNLYVAAKALAR